MGNMLFTNNASSKLASGITISSTTITVATGSGSLFPTVTGSQYFKCTLSTTDGIINEIVKVTSRTGDVLTVVRAQEGTSAYAFSANDKVELRATAETLANFGQLDSTNTWAQAQTFTSPVAPTSGGTGLSTYTSGDILYASGAGTLSKLGIGSTSQILSVSGGVPTWINQTPIIFFTGFYLSADYSTLYMDVNDAVTATVNVSNYLTWDVNSTQSFSVINNNLGVTI